MNSMKNRSFTRRMGTVAAAAALAASLAACGGMTQRERSTATGAVVGGAAGAVLGGGTAGTVGGAAVGAVIGNQIERKREEK